MNTSYRFYVNVNDLLQRLIRMLVMLANF